MVARWGVLTDTTFHLFDHTTAKLIVSLDLAKLQVIKSSAQPKSDPSRLFPLKLYAGGTMYVLYVSSVAQQQLPQRNAQLESNVFVSGAAPFAEGFAS